ncbi:hypothetical protein [Glycomyces paridis]|uniref:Uncharacterized protein n=1 Tax=Glycomyces paridis TaxID=2126555 RepID=A0A4V4HNK5_9ACTN|nr:hypothetical protein [Glycomyces paridis]THV26426.1 hypothetical protein E9998_17845 [Glycomyces paridis]
MLELDRSNPFEHTGHIAWFPHGVGLPDRGTDLVRLDCGMCGASLPIELVSIASVRARIRRVRAMAAGVGSIGALTFAAVWSVESQEGPVLLAALLALVGAAMTTFGFIVAFTPRRPQGTARIDADAWRRERGGEATEGPVHVVRFERSIGGELLGA